MSDQEPMKNRRVDIRALARISGYSVGTVSMALNGNPMVKKSTAEHILNKAQEIGYVPNIIAQLIATRNSGAVGVMVPNSLPPLFPSIVYGIHHAFESVGQRAFVVYSLDDPESEVYFLKVFGQLRVSGLIAAVCPGSKALQELESLREQGVSIVMIDREMPGFSANYCGFDHRVQASQLANHLLSEGRRRIAIAGAQISYSTIEERREGVWDALKAAGITRSSYLEVDLEYDHTPVRTDERDRNVEKLKDFLSGVQPDALICTLDGLLPSVKEAAAALGLRVPQDMRVFSFDNLHRAEVDAGGVAKSYRPGVDLGKEAADLLLERVKNPPQAEAFKTKIIETEGLSLSDYTAAPFTTA